MTTRIQYILGKCFVGISISFKVKYAYLKQTFALQIAYFCTVSQRMMMCILLLFSSQFFHVENSWLFTKGLEMHMYVVCGVDA